METEINKIKCPYCKIERAITHDDEDGPFGSREEQCDQCGKYFFLESEIYLINWSYRTRTEEEQERELDWAHESIMQQIRELKQRRELEEENLK